MASLTPKTFASIDLAGASRLWTDSPPAMGHAVALMCDRAETLLAKFDGRTCRSNRRDWTAIFDRPVDALQWACALQQDLLETYWPDEILAHPEAAEVRQETGELLFRGLRTSIGLALGASTRRQNPLNGENEYAGEAVDRAVQLARAAEVGQVVMSSEAYHAVAAGFWDAFDGLVEAQTLGAREGSAYAWPRMVLPASLAGRKGPLPIGRPSRVENLPDHDSRFIGRFDELHTLSELQTADSRWASLVGPAGAGKTRLATEFARLWLDEPAEAGSAARREAWFCDLTQADRVEDLLYTVARVLGVQLRPSEGNERLADRLGSALAGRGQVVLILDNAEEVVDMLAPILQSWLDSAQKLRIIVTSQRACGADEEAVVPVETLGAASAHALLEDRLAAPKRIRVNLGEADRAALDEILEYCGELPLAIELAAAIGRALTPRQLLQAWVESGDKTPIARLEHAIARTNSLLGEPEREVLRQCSVFTSVFTLEDAQAVVDLSKMDLMQLDGAPAVADVLELLHEHSLLQASVGRNSAGGTRFTFYEPVRRFAHKQWDDEAEQHARLRHARWFAEWGERAISYVDTPDEIRWIERLVDALPNLGQAWEFCYPDEPELAVRLAEVFGELDRRIGPLGNHGKRTEKTLELVSELDDPRMRATAYYVRGLWGLWGDDSDADEQFEHVLQTAREMDDELRQVEALFGLAYVAMNSGYYQKALEYGREARQLIEGSGTVDEVYALNWCGVALHALGETEASLQLLGEAIVPARRLGVPSCVAAATSALGVRLSGERASEGRRYLEEANHLFHILGNRRQFAASLLGIARLAGWEGDHETAELYYDRGKEACEAIGESYFDVLLLQGRGRSRLLQGRFVEAHEDLEEALVHLDNNVYLDLRVWVLATASACCAALSRTGEAESYLAQAREAVEGTDALKLDLFCDVAEGYLLAARARQTFAANDDAAAEEALGQAVERCKLSQHKDISRFPNVASFAQGLREALDDQLEQGLVPPHISLSKRLLEIGPDARWFAIDRGEHVDISRRGALRKILAALVDRRIDEPGEPLSVDDVMSAGWPDEVLTPSSGARRVYSTINRMRDVGLEEVLQTVDDGYMIDPTVTPIKSKRHD